ncbi:hypothetical protein [uncultured Mediterranean phage uvMED]|nr:hypothetical protein [uncultured Mediterranean phage uvMED]BAR16262.1 hypothetical protein [uncultured Mediterranean phage uvMED]
MVKKNTRQSKKPTDNKTMTHEDIFKEFNYECLNEQVGGSHYKKLKVSPAYFICENKLLFAEGNIVKLACRHQNKNKSEDIKKIIHYCEIILERDYPDEKKD